VADINQVLAAAHQLGQMILEQPTAKAYADIRRQLTLDVGAQNLLGQFEQFVEQLGAKEASGLPIEIAEKQQLQNLQQSISMHPLLKKMITVQNQFQDIMQAVNASINAGMTGQAVPQVQAGGENGDQSSGESAPAAPPEPAPEAKPQSKIILE
jgi:cell fate (sporulation/competence/biofilm development) regulator YlbF (YheA/YmcA/DUF963 family)